MLLPCPTEDPIFGHDPVAAYTRSAFPNGECPRERCPSGPRRLRSTARNRSAVAGSSNGKVLFFANAGTPSNIHRATFCGRSWHRTNLTAALDASGSTLPGWTSIACSAGGNVLVAWENSSDGGQAGDIWAWVSPAVGGNGQMTDLTPSGSESAKNWSAIGLSANGSEIAVYDASIYGGGLFMGK